jgi:predicted O-methyltransferase YrrM
MFGLRRAASRAFRRSVGVNGWVEQALVLPVGQVTLTEARFLGDLVRSLSGTGPIIEIGTLFGWSTRVMALCKDPGRELISVDGYCWNPLGLSSEGHYQVTARILAEAVRDHNVRLVRADKATFYESYAGPPAALVFLDADHSYEQTAVDIAWARSVGTGVVCLHDYRSDCPGVVRAVDEAGGPRNRVGSLVVLG